MTTRKKSNREKKSRDTPKRPPRQTDPKIFTAAFTERLGQDPVTYLISKLKSGSDIDSIHYLFDIISAEIERKNNCLSRGFHVYFQ